MSRTTTRDRAKADERAAATTKTVEALGSEAGRWTTATTASSRRAYERRIRRRQKMSDDRLVRPGRTVSTVAFDRAPFVVALIALLGLGVTAVLWLNTLTDEAGMRTSSAKSKTTDLRLTIEELRRDVAMLDATPRIADQAKALGMVQAGDSAMLIVDGSGAGTVVGEPSAVAAPAPPPAPTEAAAPAPSPGPAAAPAPAPPAAEQPAQPGPAAAPAAPAAEQPAQPDPAAAPTPADQAAAPPTSAPPGEPQGAGQ